MFRRILLYAATLILGFTLTAQAAVVTLTPVGGSVKGAPGATVGWGYTFTNDSATDWIVLTDSAFSPLPAWGLYDDYVLKLANPILGPDGSGFSSITHVYDAVAGTGTGSFTIDPLAPGKIALGEIVFGFNVYDGDPENGGQLVEVGGNGGYYTLPVSASVTAVPEPSTYALLCISLGVVGYARRRMVKG